MPLTFTFDIELLATALSVSGPTFAWVLLGVVLRRAGLLTEALIAASSRLAFNLILPLLLFSAAVGVDYGSIGAARYVLAGILATLLALLAGWLYSRWRAMPRGQDGVFIQAVFRSNLAIVGIALCHAAYGERGLALAALPVAIMTALYNVLAVIVLQLTLGARNSLPDILLGIARNPLLIGIGAGVVLALLQLPLPHQVESLGTWLSTWLLPVILVSIGGAIRLDRLHRLGAIAWEASLWRLCVAPLLGTVLAIAMGVEGEPLGVLFLLLASPVAAASFVMVVAARGDGVLAANIVVVTTLLSCITVTAGFMVLVALNLVGTLI